jgi:hypothetical protein
MTAKNVKKDPTFIEQAFAIIEETYANNDGDKEHGMKIGDHKLLCRVLDAHERYIDDKIIDRFALKISEHYKPIMDSLDGLEKGQKSIVDNVIHIKADITDIRMRLLKHEERITKLETVTEMPRSFNNRILKLEIYASIKWTVIRWTIAVIVAVLIGISLFLWHENNKLISQTKVDNWKLYQEQLDNYSGTVRGAEVDTLAK